MILYYLRRITQLAVLSAILFCWLDIWVPASAVLPWLPRFSPLMTAATRLTAWQWTPYFAGGVLVAFSALLLPRFFCGWVCPLGACIDITDTITLARKRKMRIRTRWWVACLICLGLLIASGFGYNVAGFADPLTIVTHTLAQTGSSESFAAQQQAAGGGIENIGWIMTGIFIAILSLTVLGRRSWCRFFCPLGGMLGILGWLGITRRFVSDDCIHCGKCSADCKMNAISKDGTQTTHPSCIFCNSCVKVCPENAVRFK